MKKTILMILAASLIAVSTAQMAVAAERHHVRKVGRAPASDQFRNAPNAVIWPATPSSVAYTEGHVISAPAGR